MEGNLHPSPRRFSPTDRGIPKHFPSPGFVALAFGFRGRPVKQCCSVAHMDPIPRFRLFVCLAI